MKIKVGDTVRISMPIYNRYCIGKVESVDGYDVYVRMNYRRILVHRYPCEILNKV